VDSQLVGVGVCHAALKADKAKTLEQINGGQGGFLDRDLSLPESACQQRIDLRSQFPMTSPPSTCGGYYL
jgi:hypothetical protein